MLRWSALLVGGLVFAGLRSTLGLSFLVCAAGGFAIALAGIALDAGLEQKRQQGR
jgi:hypothetical protein